MTHKNSHSLSLSTVRICETLYLASEMFNQRQPRWEAKCGGGGGWTCFQDIRRRQSWGRWCPGDGSCLMPTWNGADVPAGVCWPLPKLHASQVIRAFLWIQWLQVLHVLQNGGGNPLASAFVFTSLFSFSLPLSLPSLSPPPSLFLAFVYFFFAFFLLIASQSNCTYSLEYMVNNSFWIAHPYKGPDSLCVAKWAYWRRKSCFFIVLHSCFLKLSLAVCDPRKSWRFAALCQKNIYKVIFNLCRDGLWSVLIFPFFLSNRTPEC